MDSLSFDDLIPQQDTAEPTQPEPSLSFDDLVPAKESDSISILGRSLARGTADAITGVGQSGQILAGNTESLKPEVRPSDDPELDKLLKQSVADGWSNPNWWIANTMTPLAGSAPTLAGAIGGAGLAGAVTKNPYGAAAGGAGGAAAAAVMQTLGPAYVRGLEDGLNADDAFERAWTQAGVSGAFSAVSGALPMFAVAGKTAEGALKAPVKEALFQMFVAQPGVGVAEQAVQTKIEGDEITFDDLTKAYIGEAVAGGVLDVGTNLVTGGYKAETVSERGGGEAERAALVGGSLPETETVAPESDVDPAVAQAVSGTPVEAPVAPKLDALLEIARRRDQRGQGSDNTVPNVGDVLRDGTEVKSVTSVTVDGRKMVAINGKPYSKMVDGKTGETYFAPAIPPVTPTSNQQAGAPTAVAGEPPTAVGAESAAPPAPPTAAQDDIIERAVAAIQESGVTKPYYLGRMLGIPQNKAADILLQLSKEKRLVEFKNNQFRLLPTETLTAPNDEITANVPEEPVTGESNAAEPEVTVPESQDTLNIHRAELVDPDNARIAVQYPKGTNMKLYPKPDSPRIERFPSGKYGTFDFDASKISRDEIRAAARAGRLNELLGLGPYNKQQVAESAAAGAAPVAVTERTPDGTEVKAAAGTEETAPEQLQALEEAKTPGNTVQVEDPRKVIKERKEAPPVRKIDPNSLTAEERQRLGLTNAPTQEAPASKAEQAKETSKARAAQGPESAEVTSEVAPPVERIVKGRRVLEDTSPEGIANSKAAAEARDRAEAARLAAEQAAAEEAAKEKERITQKAADLETLNSKVENKEFGSIEEEALSRATVGGANLQNQDKEAIVRGAVISKNAFDKGSPILPDVITSGQDLRQLATVLDNLLVDARTEFVEAQKTLKDADRNKKLTTKAKRALGTRTKGDYPTVTGHVIWLSEAASLSRRIDLMGDDELKINELLVDVNDFLNNSASLNEGDDTPLREKRKQKGAEIAASRSSDIADNRQELGGVQDMKFTESVRDEENAAGGRAFDNEGDTSVSNESLDESEVEIREGEGYATRNATSAAPVSSRLAKAGAATVEAEARAMNERRKAKLAEQAQDKAALKEADEKEGPAYTEVRATKQPAVETKKKRKLLKRETVAGEESFAPLDESTILQTVTFAEALSQADMIKGSGINRTVINRMLTRLSKRIGNVKVHVVPQESLDAMYPDRPANNLDGFYDPEKNYIVVSENFIATGSFDARILAHEGTHAYLSMVLDLDKTLKQDFQQVLDYARSVAPNQDVYGLTNVHEMLAEAMSNPEFQNFLMGIKMPQNLASKYDMPQGTMWQLFVEAIRKHLGLGRNDVDALSYVLRLGDRAEARVNKMSPRENKFFRQAWAEGLLGSQGRQRSYADELAAAGVPADVAAELDAFINAELGKAIDPATLDLFMEDLKAEYGQDTSASNAEVPEEEAKKKSKKAKAETEKQAKRMMRDTTKSREELLDEAYLQALEEFKPGRVPKQNSKALLSLLMNNQLALISDNFFGRDTNPVRRIADLIEMRRTGKQSYVEELGEVAQKLYDLERVYRQKDIKAWEKFVSLAHDATMAQVHPDKPLSDEIHKYLGSDDAVSGKWSKKQHPRLATMYNSLPGDLKALYRETRDALSATRDRVELGNISTVLRKMGHNDEALAKRFLEKKSTKADRQLVGDVVADYIESIVRLSAINGPYFNLARQGDIVLTGRYKVTTPSNAKKIKDGVFEFRSRNEAVKFAEEQMLRPTISRIAVDPKTGERFFVDDDGTQVKATFADPSAEERYRVTVQTKYVEFFHSEAAAREKAEALKDAVELNDVEPKRIERAAANADMLSDQMRALASTLDTRLKGANLTTEQKAVLKGTLNEASLRFMASTRLQTHRLPRRYVQGASKDLVVSTYQYIDSSAGYLAKLDTQVQLEDAMRLMEKGINALSSRREGIGGGARAISNEVERRVNNIDYNMDQGLVAGAANRIMAVNFINHLMSPMYTVLQVVQTPLVAGPVLSAEYGAVRTSYHLAKASKDIGALQIGLKGVVATAKGLAGINTPGRTYTDYARARLGREEQRAIDKLIALGVVDSDAGFDVTRLERKDNKIARGVDATLEYFGNIARAAPQSVEAINRAAVGLATFRMARADKLSFEEAVRKAQEAVELTHFNLSASNAAPIFRNPVGRLLLQFKKYGQNIYFLHYYNAARMIRPKVAGDRLKGAKTLLYLAATHQVAAGLVGLPIEPLKIAVMVLGMIPGMPEWEDLEREAEEALADLTDKGGAEALMYGLPNLAGIDISSRVGLSSLLLFGEPGEMGDKNSVQAWFLNLLLGPTVGSATDIASGVAAAAEGDPLKAAEKLLPVKVISDTLRAVGEVDDGKFDTEDALLRAFGVQSTRQSRIQRDTSADIDKRTDLKRQKNAIIKAWLSADTAGERSKVIARMREYNREAGKRDKLSTKFLNNIKRREERKYQNEE